MDSYMLTTVDNPYNPSTQFDSWFAYDTQKGYDSCSYLDRIVETKTKSFNSLSHEQQTSIINDAIDEIINENILGIYKKIKREI